MSPAHDDGTVGYCDNCERYRKLRPVPVEGEPGEVMQLCKVCK